MNVHNLTKLFCSIDDFCKTFIPKLNQSLLEDGLKKRNRPKSLSISEIMTILAYFHHSKFRDFKHCYFFLLAYEKSAFPGLPSYSRFVQWIASVLLPMFAYLHSRKAKYTGVYFIDSTTLSVCHNKRIFNHKVFDGLAKRGKSTMGYFFGFKLHLVINDLGEIVSFQFTVGNTDDRNPVEKLVKNLTGKLFGDKGYISTSLFEKLFGKGLKLVTGVRSNMKNKLMLLWDKILLRKRSIIETVNDHLKNVCQIEHTRHRSPTNFVVHLLSGLIAYFHLPKKPKIKWNQQPFQSVINN